MSEEAMNALKCRLDETHQWPATYVFKFIVKKEHLEELVAVLPDDEVNTRESSKANFISVTIEPIMNSSAEVIEVYRKTAAIKGLIAL